MKYIIMADGKMSRWNSKDGTPKHLVKINGETLLERIVHQIRSNSFDSEIIITSHNPLYEVKGACRYEPKNNIYEIDRFTEELIDDNCCFLYGDTYYTDDSIKQILNCEKEDLHFFGNMKSMIAVVVTNSKIMRACINDVKCLYLKGQLKECKGWQVYQCYKNLPYDEISIEGSFSLIEDGTQGFNTFEEYAEFMKGISF